VILSTARQPARLQHAREFWRCSFGIPPANRPPIATKQTMKTNTQMQSSIDTLIEMDHQEAALREQLQQLALRKEEAKKTKGEEAKEQLYEKIPSARVHLLGLLRTAQNLGIEIDGEYTTTLHRIVKEAGATGIPLSLVQEVLPDLKKLQAAREDLGPKGTGEIIELTAKEHLKEGKGRGLFFVWNDDASSATPEVPEGEVGTTAEPGEPADQGELDEQPAPAPAKQSVTKPSTRK
jgi:hypothetical protein